MTTETLSNTQSDTPLRRFQDQYPARKVETEGGTWSFRDTDPGSKRTPIVMLPGAGGTGDVFYRAVEGIRTSRRVVTVAYPALPDVEALTSGLGAALSHMGIGELDVCGSSVGGYLAQLFVHETPERVRRCMVCNSFLNGTFLQNKIPYDKLLNTPASEHFQNTLRQLGGLREETIEEADFKRTMLALVGREQTAEMAKATLLAALGATQVGLMPLLPSHVAILDTEDDPVVDESTRVSVRERYAGSPQYRLRTGGHYPALLNPTAFTQALRAHFAEERP
jgi:maspardin